MKNLRQRITIGLIGLVVLAALVVFGKRKAQGPRAPTEAAPGVTTVYAVDAWLDSCLAGCRRTASRRLANLPLEKRERYCTVNCECGMEKMTEPGPAPHTVRAPSARWRGLSEDDQLKAAAECQQRTNSQIGK